MKPSEEIYQTVDMMRELKEFKHTHQVELYISAIIRYLDKQAEPEEQKPDLRLVYDPRNV